MTEILILGTAPEPFVDNAVRKIQSLYPDARISVWLRTGCELDWDNSINILFFQGFIQIYNLSLLKSFWAIRPDVVFVVIGNNFFHENVVKACRTWSLLLLRKCGINVVSGKEGRIESSDVYLADPVYREKRKNFILVATGICFLLVMAHLFFGFSGPLICLLGWILAEAMCHVLHKAYGFKGLFSEPGGVKKLVKHSDSFVIRDERTGWKNNPGVTIQTTVDVPDMLLSHKWTATHDHDGRRVSSDSRNEDTLSLDEIAVAGCSLTYGDGLADHETYPWLLQEKFNELSVVNYGVGGYSLLQVLFQMEDILKQKPIKTLVLGFHGGLVERSVKHMSWWGYAVRNNTPPLCVSKNKRLLVTRGVPAFRQVLYADEIKTLEVAEFVFNKLVNKPYPGHVVHRTGQHLLLKLRDICYRHNTNLLVACLLNSEVYYSFLVQQGFSWVMCDVEELRAKGKTYNLLPFDSHPNAHADVFWAEKIGGAIEQIHRNKRVSPTLETIAALKGGKSDMKEGERYVYPHF